MYKLLCTPSLHYTLPVSNIPSKALKSMQTKLLKTFKRKMKFLSNMTNSIMFGPRQWCGLSLRESCFEKGLSHIRMLFGHLHGNRSAASTIYVCIITLHPEMGLVMPILSSEYSAYSLIYLEDWIKTTWKFLADSKITLMAKFWTTRLPREGDVSLMAFVAQHRGKFKRKQLIAINRC
jgi:hypothetical protein